MSQSDTFETRLRRLGRRHARMYQNGVVARMGRDGLISAYPRRRMPRFPLRGLLVLFCAAVLFKSFLFAWLGSGVYEARVSLLADGTWVERAGAWVMQPDPATELVAGFIGPFLPKV